MEEEEIKKKISCHPMFAVSKATHLHCLKICSGDQEAASSDLDQLQGPRAKQPANPSDLDLFMEAHAAALVALAREIEKPMKEAAAFTELVYRHLQSVTGVGTAGGVEDE
ncbi:unnamed protein product [Spirodela intermedia]|nr:unnamed protein product [Spirodela intermedia]CAA6659378.1 unnamed protein product [Spirodela intermedia]